MMHSASENYDRTRSRAQTSNGYGADHGAATDGQAQSAVAPPGGFDLLELTARTTKHVANLADRVEHIAQVWANGGRPWDKSETTGGPIGIIDTAAIGLNAQLARLHQAVAKLDVI